MKKFTNQFYVSHADRMNNGGGKFRRIALFPLMLLMLLLLPTRMVAQTANGNRLTPSLTIAQERLHSNAVPSPQELMTLTRGKNCRSGLRKEIRSRR